MGIAGEREGKAGKGAQETIKAAVLGSDETGRGLHFASLGAFGQRGSGEVEIVCHCAGAPAFAPRPLLLSFLTSR